MTSRLPRSRSTDHRFYGVVEAVVAKVTGDPGHECRVKLTFHFDGGKNESDWCRVVQPYAGNGYGAVFVPEKGDEVLVAFRHGDMRYPFVLGGLYNGTDKPPTDRTASRDQKLIRTKHGHRVLLDDSPGQEAIRVTTAGGRELILNDVSGTVAVTGNGVKITLRGHRHGHRAGREGHRRGRADRAGLGGGRPEPDPRRGVPGDLQHPHPRAPGPARWRHRAIDGLAATDQPCLLPDCEDLGMRWPR